MRLVILGGSSPYTLLLGEPLASVDTFATGSQLVLQGRDARFLGYNKNLLSAFLVPAGWTVTTCQDRTAALAGADVVFVQTRFGGLEGRAADERLAQSLDLPPDETLGVGGLRAALRLTPEFEELAATLAQAVPTAAVINLMNPLSVATSILSGHRPARVWGVCELPARTAAATIAALGLPTTSPWAYAGLNHRGFVHTFLEDGRTVDIAVRAKVRGAKTVGGFPVELVAELDAVPTKYFSLIGGTPISHPGRAAALQELRLDIARELAHDDTVLPTALRRRPSPWYAEAVVPLLAWLGGATDAVVASRCDDDGISRERWQGIETPPAPEPLLEWLERFERHEAAVLEAVAHPTRARILRALELDPTLPKDQARAAAAAVIDSLTDGISGLQEH